MAKHGLGLLFWGEDMFFPMFWVFLIDFSFVETKFAAYQNLFCGRFQRNAFVYQKLSVMMAPLSNLTLVYQELSVMLTHGVRRRPMGKKQQTKPVFCHSAQLLRRLGGGAYIIRRPPFSGRSSSPECVGGGGGGRGED